MFKVSGIKKLATVANIIFNFFFLNFVYKLSEQRGWGLIINCGAGDLGSVPPLKGAKTTLIRVQRPQPQYLSIKTCNGHRLVISARLNQESELYPLRGRTKTN